MKSHRLMAVPIVGAVQILCLITTLAREPQSLPRGQAEIVVFKNGLAAITRVLDIPRAGEYVVDDLPVPVHGSCWLIPDGVLELSEVRAYPAIREEPTTPQDLTALLKANIGKPVELLLTSSKVDKIYGTIRDVRTVPEVGEVSDPFRYPQDSRSHFVLLDTEQGTWGLYAHNILALKGHLLPDIDDLSAKRARGAIRFATNAAGKLKVLYIARNCTWAPSYLVDVTDPKEVVFQAKAVLVNDSEDIADSVVLFATGHPNFAFAEIPDPLALTGDVQKFLGWLRRPPIMEYDPNAKRTEMVVIGAAPIKDPYTRNDSEPPPSMEPEDDLYFYKETGVTLKKGERAYFSLFNKRLPYEDLYLLEVKDYVTDRTYWSGQGQDKAGKLSDVWHVLRLRNNTGAPWTFAPALTIKGGKVAGQDILSYTPPGADTLLRITRALAINGSTTEWEVKNLESPAAHYPGTDLRLIRVQGEIALENSKDKPIKIIVKKRITGELIGSSLERRAERVPELFGGVNSQWLITWEFSLAAGQKQKLSYEYKVYAKR